MLGTVLLKIIKKHNPKAVPFQSWSIWYQSEPSVRSPIFFKRETDRGFFLQAQCSESNLKWILSLITHFSLKNKKMGGTILYLLNSVESFGSITVIKSEKLVSWNMPSNSLWDNPDMAQKQSSNISSVLVKVKVPLRFWLPKTNSILPVFVRLEVSLLDSGCLIMLWQNLNSCNCSAFSFTWHSSHFFCQFH